MIGRRLVSEKLIRADSPLVIDTFSLLIFLALSSFFACTPKTSTAESSVFDPVICAN